jgi:molecular chaperone DnaK
MSHVIGIDLGTTNSCIAIMEGAEPMVIPNLDGFNTTPSIVSFSGDARLVGNIALRQAIVHPENSISGIKRLMGQKFQSLEGFRKRLSYRIEASDNGDAVVRVENRTLSPPEISAFILGYLKNCAESYFGGIVEEAVITVPAHFDDHQRQATKDAAKIAGLNVLREVNEPTAASMTYGLNSTENAVVAVYDIGGGTFDITIMEISEGIFHVLATDGNTYLGGEDFDNRLVDWISDDFFKEHGVDLFQNKLAHQRVKEAMEKAKKDLSFTQSTEINLPFILTGSQKPIHIHKTVTRDLLEHLTGDLVDKTFPFIEQALQDSGFEPNAMDKIILAGGQSRMPLIRRRIADFFGKPPSAEHNPEEIVAKGAAVQAGILQGDMSKLIVLLDVTPLSLGIETEKDTFETIIERNTTIPTRETKQFTTVEHNQRQVKIHVLQGESQKASENTSLAEFQLVGIEPAPEGVPQIDVTFMLDADGIVKVSAKVVETGKEQSVQVKPSSGLSHTEIDAIIEREIEKGSKN